MSAWSYYETHLDAMLEKWEGEREGGYKMAYLVQISRALEKCAPPKKRETVIAWRTRVRPGLLLRLAQDDLREFRGDPPHGENVLGAKGE